MAYKYVSKVSGKEINSSNVIYVGDGILESIGGTALKYIPSSSLKAVMTDADGGYGKAELPSVPDGNNGGTTVSGYRKYLLGLDSIRALKSRPAKVNGFIAKEVEVHNCSYVELSAVASGEGNIEYSFIDGLKEQPILPVDQTVVVKEKLFPGQDTRFVPDTSYEITIYQDGAKTDYALDSISSLDFGSHEYSVSYRPVASAHRYKPTGTKLKVKVIQRCEDVPVKIRSLVILRHGGEKIWTM